MIKVPGNDKNFAVDNASDRRGNISQTKNINFDEEGYLKLERKLNNIVDSSVLTDLGDNGKPLSVIASYDTYEALFAVANDGIYQSESVDFSASTPGTTSTDYLNFDKNTSTGVPNASVTGRNDMIQFGTDKLYFVNGTSTLYKYKGGTTDTWTSVANMGGNIIKRFLNIEDTIAIGDNSGAVAEVRLLDGSDVSAYSFNIPEDFFITCMAWSNDRMFIGTQNKVDGDAVIIEWDGKANSPNFYYDVKGHTVYAMTAYLNGIAFMTSEGQLMYLAGGQQELANLPIYYTNLSWESEATDNPLDRRVGHNGLVADGDILYISIDGNIDRGIDINEEASMYKMPSGVWCFDPKVGLYHRWSVSQARQLRTDPITTGNVDTSTDIITVAGETVPATGTPVFYQRDIGKNGATDLAPLVQGTKYFTIYQSDTTVKLATTYANALSNTAIDLTGTGNNAQFLVFTPQDSFGSSLGQPGALLLNRQVGSNTIPSTEGYKLWVGAGIASNTSTTGNDLTSIQMVADKQENRGYFMTPWFDSSQVEDMYNSIYNRYRNLPNVDDIIKVKYITKENTLRDYVYSDLPYGTWSDADTFTTTEDLSNIVAGDEIEVVRGAGEGYVVCVDSISEAGGTYTVNIDESVKNISASDSMQFILRSWTSVGTTTTADCVHLYKKFTVGKTSKKVKFKVELQGYDVTIEDYIINNENHKPVV